MRRLLVALLCLLCIAVAQAEVPVRVGSKADNEGAVLGQIVLQVLRREGIPVTDRTQLGPTSIVRRALVNGDLDVYPEYTGNAGFFFHREADPAFRDAARAYALASSLDQEANHLVWLHPAPADNHWAIGVRADIAKANRLRTLDDFARWVNGNGRVYLAGSAEFVESDAALPAFQAAYGFRLRGDQLLVLAGGDTSATIKAAAEGTSGVNASMVYSTDGALAMTGLVVLEDPRHVEMVYQPAPVVREQVLKRYPVMRDALEKAFRPLTVEVLQHLNARTQIDGEDASKVAADYLRGQGAGP
ncbi:glycine betaine ABC transporter substrate-binding protein OsmF [Luteibacter anthropi]|uniref:ABC transporter substrate-binding protein n=1 Tax=Luteibacter anthropi TaxID=564369 RepID=A0A7X5UEF9_9GAMM|nr:ABC transporter substrate-binding protein [Luteibacter anthropi]NII08999.1 ABC transporter substrate-binding protein [Luteibacter anthropi]